MYVCHTNRSSRVFLSANNTLTGHKKKRTKKKRKMFYIEWTIDIRRTKVKKTCYRKKRKEKITQETNKQKIERNTYVRKEKYLYMPSFFKKSKYILISFCFMLFYSLGMRFLQTLFYKHICKRQKERRKNMAARLYSCVSQSDAFFYRQLCVYTSEKKYSNVIHIHSHPIVSIIRQARLDYYHHH
jgi:hypothetical protein